MFPFANFDHEEIHNFSETVAELSKIHDNIDRQRKSYITMVILRNLYVEYNI